MKRTNQILVLLVALVLFTVGQAFAYPVTNGDSVYLSAYVTDPSVSGKDIGNWSVYSDTNSYLFETFCVEETVYFWDKVVYQASIDTLVKTDRESIFGTALALGTKYLYWNFINGTLVGYEGTTDNVSDLQDAIWGLQAGATSGNEFFDLAGDYAGDGSELNVVVMNLWDAEGNNYQSQLIAGSAPVPEPATMVLLGSGLVGLALYRRRMKK